jgi:hypothetical protein
MDQRWSVDVSASRWNWQAIRLESKQNVPMGWKKEMNIPEMKYKVGDKFWGIVSKSSMVATDNGCSVCGRGRQYKTVHKLYAKQFVLSRVDVEITSRHVEVQYCGKSRSYNQDGRYYEVSDKCFSPDDKDYRHRMFKTKQDAEEFAKEQNKKNT